MWVHVEMGHIHVYVYIYLPFINHYFNVRVLVFYAEYPKYFSLNTKSGICKNAINPNYFSLRLSDKHDWYDFLQLSFTISVGGKTQNMSKRPMSQMVKMFPTYPLLRRIFLMKNIWTTPLILKVLITKLKISAHILEISNGIKNHQN